MFYGHAMFTGGNSHKGSRYLSFPSSLSLSCPVDTKTDFNLNNIIATLSLISISLVKQFAGKCPDMALRTVLVITSVTFRVTLKMINFLLLNELKTQQNLAHLLYRDCAPQYSNNFFRCLRKIKVEVV